MEASPDSLAEKVGRIEEKLGKLSKSPILSSVDMLERRSQAKTDRASEDLDSLKSKLRELEERDKATLDQVYGGLKELDSLKKSIYPYAEDRNEGQLLAQMKESERKIGNIIGVVSGDQEFIKKLDSRIAVLEHKIEAVESVVGRIDFPIDQLRNLFSILLDTNTQMKEFELEILTALKRIRKLEEEVRAGKVAPVDPRL